MSDSEYSRYSSDDVYTDYYDSESRDSFYEQENNENARERDKETPNFDFTVKTWRSDFVLVVEGTKLYVAKNILSLASPVFDTMFQSEFKESSSDELELPGKNLDDVIEFLRCLYPNTMAFSQITTYNVFKMLPLIEEYQVVQLKPKCEEVLIRSVNNATPAEELFELLQDACMYNLKDLRGKCINLASCRTDDELDEASEKFPPTPDVAKEILEKVNKKLRKSVSNLQKSFGKAREKNRRLKRKNSDLKEEQTIVEQYLSAEMKKTKHLKLDIEHNWKGKHVVLAVDMEGGSKSKSKVTIWGTRLTICAFVGEERLGREILKFEVKNRGKKIHCTWKCGFIFVNRQPQGHNEVLICAGKFPPETQVGQHMVINVKQKDEIMDMGSGFVCDGKIGIIVQMYMTEPNKC